VNDKSSIQWSFNVAFIVCVVVRLRVRLRVPCCCCCMCCWAFSQINLIKPLPKDKTQRQTLLYFDWLIGVNQHLWRICSVDLRRLLESTSPTAIHVQRHVLVPLVEISILQNPTIYIHLSFEVKYTGLQNIILTRLRLSLNSWTSSGWELVTTGTEAVSPFQAWSSCLLAWISLSRYGLIVSIMGAYSGFLDITENVLSYSGLSDISFR